MYTPELPEPTAEVDDTIPSPQYRPERHSVKDSHAADGKVALYSPEPAPTDDDFVPSPPHENAGAASLAGKPPAQM